MACHRQGSARRLPCVSRREPHVGSPAPTTWPTLSRFVEPGPSRGPWCCVDHFGSARYFSNRACWRLVSGTCLPPSHMPSGRLLDSSGSPFHSTRSAACARRHLPSLQPEGLRHVRGDGAQRVRVRQAPRHRVARLLRQRAHHVRLAHRGDEHLHPRRRSAAPPRPAGCSARRSSRAGSASAAG